MVLARDRAVPLPPALPGTVSARRAASESRARGGENGARCQLCLEGEGAGPLVRSCACRGSANLVHGHCREHWRRTGPRDLPLRRVRGPLPGPLLRRAGPRGSECAALDLPHVWAGLDLHLEHTRHGAGGPGQVRRGRLCGVSPLWLWPICGRTGHKDARLEGWKSHRPTQNATRAFPPYKAARVRSAGYSSQKDLEPRVPRGATYPPLVSLQKIHSCIRGVPPHYLTVRVRVRVRVRVLHGELTRGLGLG